MFELCDANSMSSQPAQRHGHARDERRQRVDDHGMRLAPRAFQALLRAVAEALEDLLLVADDDGREAARREQFRVVVLRCGHLPREPQIRRPAPAAGCPGMTSPSTEFG